MPSEIYWHPSTTFWTWQNKYPYHFPTYYKGIQVRDKLDQKKKKMQHNIKCKYQNLSKIHH